MKRAFVFAAAIAAVLAIAAPALQHDVAIASTPAPNQILDVRALVANQSASLYTWKTTAPATPGPGTPAPAVTWTQLQSYVNTKACYLSAGAQLVAWQDVLACSAANTVAAHTITFSGTASGAVFCNPACQTNGDHAQPAQPFTQSFIANSISAAHPVSYTFTITPGSFASCSWQLTDGGGAVRATGTASVSNNSLTAGTVGTWVLEFDETVSAGLGAFTCAVSGGSITSYY